MTSTSEYVDCHILLWNKLTTVVFVNLSGRSRITLTDNLVNKTHNKTKPATRSVRRPRKWFRTLAMWSCLDCSRLIPRRSAKNASHTGSKASSIVHAGTSWKKVQRTKASSKKNRTFSQFQTMWLRRYDFMVPVLGKLRKEYYLVHNLKNWCIKKLFGRDRRSFLARLRNRCDSNEALCTLNRLHQESGERQFRPIPFRKYQHWHQSSSSSFQLVAMEWFLVEFIVIENDDKWGCMQNDMGERWNQFCLVFGWNLWQTTFKN